MNALKEFLKPNLWKVVFTGLGFLTYFVQNKLQILYDKTIFRGLPLPFHETDFHWEVITGSHVVYLSLIIDIIIWYLFACFIFFIYSKIKKSASSQTKNQ
jgi:hypothetical protein